jgi:hypothetical protein
MSPHLTELDHIYDTFEHEFNGYTIATDSRGNKTYKMGTHKTIACAPLTPSTASSASHFVIPYRFTRFGWHGTVKDIVY